MDYLRNFFDRLVAGLPSIVAAILLIILALIIAGVVRKLIKKALNHFNEDKKLNTAGTSGEDTVNALGSLGYVLTLLLFLPGILDKLGLPSITLPIVGFLNQIFGYIPNLLGAAIILVVGFFLAKIVKQLLLAFLKRIRIDDYQEKLGIKKTSTSSMNISDALANIVYILILIPIIIAALNALNISVISDPAVAMLNNIFLMIPRIIAGIVILIIGVFLAKIIADFIYSLLEGSGLSEKVADVVEDPAVYKLNLANIISQVVRYVIIAIFLVQAFNVIQLDILNLAGTAILAYIPKVLAAILILIGAYLLATLIKKFINEHFRDSHFVGLTFKYVIFGIGVLAALTQLGIATNFLVPLFQLTVAAGALAFALAFGLGGRDFAAKKLSEADAKMKESEPKIEEVKARLKETKAKKKADFEKDVQSMKTEANHPSDPSHPSNPNTPYKPNNPSYPNNPSNTNNPNNKDNKDNKNL